MAIFVKLDVNWPDHAKVIAAGIDGAGLHAMALCIAQRLETDGIIPRILLTRVGATPELIERLIDLELLDPVDSSSVAVHNWGDRHPTRPDREAIATRQSGDGKRGNHKRWGHPVDFEECPVCFPTSDRVSPTPSPPRSGTVSGGDRVGDRVDRQSRAEQSRVEKSSSSSSDEATADPQEPAGSALLDAAAEVLARRRAELRTERTGPGWIRRAQAGIADDYRAEAERLLQALGPAEWPDAERLAELLEPSPPPRPERPADATAEAQAAFAEQVRRNGARAAETEPPADPNVARKAARAARKSLTNGRQAATQAKGSR